MTSRTASFRACDSGSENAETPQYISSQGSSLVPGPATKEMIANSIEVLPDRRGRTFMRGTGTPCLSFNETRGPPCFFSLFLSGYKANGPIMLHLRIVPECVVSRIPNSNQGEKQGVNASV